MSIRLKLLSVITVIFAVIVALLFLGSRSVVLSSFEQLELETTENNIQRIQNTLQDNLDSLMSTNSDWAYWTDTYSYMLGEYPEFIENNMSIDTLANVNLNMMLYYDVEGNLIYEEIADIVNFETLPMSAGFEALMGDGSIFTNHPEIPGEMAGFVRVDGKLIMVSSAPILTNTREGPFVGSLIMGRFIDEAQVEALANSLQFDMAIVPPTTDGEIANIIGTLSATSPIMTQVIDNNHIIGYGLLNDIFGEPAAIIQLNVTRDIYARGQQTVQLLAIVLLIAGIVTALTTSVALERLVVSRITTLSEDVGNIRVSGDDKRRVTVSNDDEVSRLGMSINTMLERLAENRTQLEMQNHELKIAHAEAEEATRLKSDFLSTMSHELRTPLNSIIGYSGIIIEGIGGEVDDDAKGMISNIYASSEHLLALINDILDISKIEAGRLQIVHNDFAIRPMVEVIAQRVSVLAKPMVSFDVEVQPDVPDIFHGDQERIVQILINLLSNAFKFTENGAVGLYLSRTDEKLIIRVRDSGIGIPPHAIQYIFEEFRQVDATSARNYQGTGLGLAIVKKLSEAMNGEVMVESELGKGSVFTVTLPLQSTIAARTAE